MKKFSVGNGIKYVLFTAATVAVLALAGSRAVKAGGDQADQAMAAIRPAVMHADMRFLADDLLEGRGTGTRGEIAAKFIASEFEAMDLEPAGDHGTYFQSVSLRSIRPHEKQTTLTVTLAGKAQSFAFRQDFINSGDAGRTETSAEAPVVYVGFGVTAPREVMTTIAAWT